MNIIDQLIGGIGHHARRLSRKAGSIASPRPRVQLKFTGSCTEAEFQARCNEHAFWYHSYYFDNGFVRHGDYDIGLDVHEYHFPASLKGLSVLDIGVGSGWFSTYFEQQGADVTCVDARGYCDFDIFGRHSNPDVSTEKSAPDRFDERGRPIYYSPVSKGFWIMRDLLGLRAQYVNARVYDVRPELFGGRTFDLVFMGSVLMHVRDPIGALMAARSVCKGMLISTTYLLPGRKSSPPLMQMRAGAGDGISWWIPNRSCLHQSLLGAGFAKFDTSRYVHLTADKPFMDAKAKATGVDQEQTLIHAWV